MSRWALLLLAACLCGTGGCTWMSYFGTDEHGSELGRTYFVGGAGSIGNVVGTFDVPRGLRAAKYRGSIETFGWQSVIGGTLRDQLDRSRNEGEGRRLARRIQAYWKKYPGRRVNVIALSAGTGIAAWALEALPVQRRIGTVVFLGSSLSREYDLSSALARIDGHLYSFHSPDDPMLKFGLALTGPVDRPAGGAGVAGLSGFELPPGASESVQALYSRRLRNRPYKAEYAEYGYYGLHADSTSPGFIKAVIAPLLAEPRDADVTAAPQERQ